MDDVETRLARLEQAEIAKATVARYARACDAKDVDQFVSDVFTADVVLRLPATEHHGIDAVATFFHDAFDAAPGTRRHFLTNHIAEHTGNGEVTVESYFLFVGAESDSVIGWGSYRDVIVIDEGSGRIRDKTIVLDVHTTSAAGWAAMSPGTK